MKTLRKAALGFATAVFVSLLGDAPNVANADTPPSVWERAKDEDGANAWQIHLAVQRRLFLAREQRATGFPAIAQIQDAEIRAARDMLMRGNAEKGKHALLRFDLAHVYFLMKDFPRAAEIYRGAIADFPDHPMVERGWLFLAFACGHTGDHQCERSAYLQVLRLETEEVLRATPTLNLAETQMHLGDLKEAIELYREALRIAGHVPTRETAPLATWGLAVALDRSGERTAAEKEARFALEIERSMGTNGMLLKSEDVFFVPKYEVDWYEGLGAAAQARVAQSTQKAVALWRIAERCFASYVNQAEKNPAGDRWLPIAKARLAQIKLERERAEKAAPREPPRPPQVDLDTTL